MALPSSDLAKPSQSPAAWRVKRLLPLLFVFLNLPGNLCVHFRLVVVVPSQRRVDLS
jgi:hypothetical protein